MDEGSLSNWSTAAGAILPRDIHPSRLLADAADRAALDLRDQNWRVGHPVRICSSSGSPLPQTSDTVHTPSSCYKQNSSHEEKDLRAAGLTDNGSDASEVVFNKHQAVRNLTMIRNYEAGKKTRYDQAADRINDEPTTPPVA